MYWKSAHRNFCKKSGVSYGRDFPDKSKRPQIHECGITAGVCF